MVAGLNLHDVLTDSLYDTGTFMPQDDGEGAAPTIPSSQVGVADPS